MYTKRKKYLNIFIAMIIFFCICIIFLSVINEHNKNSSTYFNNIRLTPITNGIEDSKIHINNKELCRYIELYYNSFGELDYINTNDMVKYGYKAYLELNTIDESDIVVYLSDNVDSYNNEEDFFGKYTLDLQPKLYVINYENHKTEYLLLDRNIESFLVKIKNLDVE